MPGCIEHLRSPSIVLGTCHHVVDMASCLDLVVVLYGGAVIGSAEKEGSTSSGSMEEGDKQSAGVEMSILPATEETYTIVGGATAIVEVDSASSGREITC